MVWFCDFVIGKVFVVEFGDVWMYGVEYVCCCVLVEIFGEGVDCLNEELCDE